MLFVLSNSIAHVVLDSPVGEENYDPGQTVNIKWHLRIAHPQDNWDLFFSTDGGSTWQELALDLPVTQLSYSWTAPDIETSQAKIKIVMDNVGANYEAESNNFSIGVFLPLDLKYPMGNENFLIGSMEQISWQVNGIVSFDSWNLFFSDDGGGYWMSLAEDLPPATLTYNWMVPQISTSQARIKLEMNIGGTIYENISGVFTLSDGVVTGLNDFQEQTDYLLVYPNPFTDEVLFEIDLNESTPVSLAIYNQIGRLVYTRGYTRLASGSHGLAWSPADVAAGLYFYRVQANGSSSTGRLVYKK